MIPPLQGGKEIVGLVGALLGAEKADVQNIAGHLFQRLAVLLIDTQQEEGQHDQNHAQRCRAAPQRPFEQKEKRDAEYSTAAETNELAFRQVERHFGFYFGQVLGDRDISHLNNLLPIKNAPQLRCALKNYVKYTVITALKTSATNKQSNTTFDMSK